MGEEAGYLGEGEDEDQVEEQLERGDALLAPYPGSSRHTSLIGEVCEPATDVAPVPITTILISLPILSEIYNPPPSETASCDKHQENMPA
jgi:hypothetical protein